jgi:phage antirepressor YoqD-like protein
MEVSNLTTINGMDSREIAEKTGKRHDNVCRDILSMLVDLEVDPLKFEAVYRGGNGEPRPCYILPKRECLILASGYSVTLRAKIIDRWVDLEATSAIQTPRSLPEALRLAADLAEKLEAAQPAVEFVERYVEAENTKGIREVAKVLGIPPIKFSNWLVSAGILFRQGAKLLPYSEHMDKGRFEVKTGEKHGHAFHQTRFTPEGIAWIAKRSKECV